MPDLLKTFPRLDGGLTRALDSAAAERLALANPPRPLRSPSALNVIGANDTIARRPGTGLLVPSPDPLAPVWFISDFASWDLRSLYPFGDLVLITETDPDGTDQVVIDWPAVTPTDYRPRPWPPTPNSPTSPSFVILAPVHGATCQLRAPTFRWTACPTATAYKLYIHTAPRLPYTDAGALDIAALTHRAEIAASATSYTPANPNLLALKTVYYVWVYATLPEGRTARAASTPFKFTTKLAAPTGLTTGAFSSLTPTLTWDVNGASGWVVQIYNGATLIHTSAVLTSATYTVPSSVLSANTTYTYTVTARDTAVGTPGCEVTSDPASITVFAGAYWSLSFATDAFYADGSGGNYTLTGMPSSPQLVPASALVNEGGWLTWRSAAGTQMTRVSNGATYANPKIRFRYRLINGNHEIELAYEATGIASSLNMAEATFAYNPSWPTNNYTLNSGGPVTPHGTIVYHA